MALTVGELNGIISIDDSEIDPALRRAENALRDSGDRMGDDAERSGQDAGQRLGDGLVRGADGRLRNTRGRFARAGQQAGDGFGDGLTDGADQGAGDAVSAAGSRLEMLKGGAAAIGLAAGAVLMDAMGQAMEQSRITGKLAASMGKTPAEAQRYGKIAGQLYADAVTEDFQGAADAIGATMAAGLLPSDATNKQIESMSTKVHDLADTFELDLGQTANAVGQILKTGLAKDGTEAVNALTVGLQKMGPRADDIADTFNEYSTIFRQLGVNVTETTGLLSQGMQAGARDTDVIADSLKEFVLITQKGGPAVDQAFAKIGLNGKEMQKAFTEGGPKAKQALDQVFDGLRGVGSESDRQAIALALFGTKAEDTQKALFALDPSNATSALGEVGGAADKMGDALRDNAGTKVEQFKRGLQQGLVDFLGTRVIPALTTVRGALGHMWDDAGKGGTAGADRVIAFFEILGQRLLTKAEELAPKIITGLGQAGQRVADYIMANPEGALKIGAIALAIGFAILTLPALVAASIGVAASLMMVGFVKKLQSGVAEKLPAWWASFTAWVGQKAGQAPGVFNVVGAAISNWFSTLWSRYISGPVSRQWNSWNASVRALPGRAVAALSPMGTSLANSASSAWSRFQAAASSRATSFLGWVRGLPGRISGNMGSLGSLLYGHGQQVVQGLWRGISSMGSWLRSTLIGWARSAIPDPIAKALGIASPSKVTKAQGRWIARGLVAGLTGSSKQVKAASTKLADIVRDSMNPGKRRSKALATISAGTKRLMSLASQEGKLATRMKAATKRLADQIKARDKLAADVKKGVLEGADITKQETGGWPQTAETILAGLRADTQAAQTFAKNLAALRKKGVRADLIAQIAQAGVEQGSSAAAALANANSSQIKQINAQQSALVTAAGQAGSTAGNAMYGAGIDAANGLIRGLKARQRAIDKQMLAIAKSMSKSIRKALGIKSPSKVMAQVGAYTGQGLRKGIEGERRAVNRSMASLVETPAPGSWDSASARARAGASQKVVLELRSSGRAEDDYLMGRMQRGIRKVAGPDVTFALTGRRGG